MKKIRYLIGVVICFIFFIPTLVWAAVSFTETTNVTVPASATVLTISSGSSADSLTVNDNNLSISLSSGQSITINSSSKVLFSVSGNTYTEDTLTCGTSQSTLVLNLTGSGLSETITVTPLSEYCSAGTSSGGGGGGGASSGASRSAAPAAEPAATPETTTSETTSETTATPVSTKTAWETQLENIYSESTVVQSTKSEILANVGVSENVAAEKASETKYITPLVKAAGAGVSSENQSRMVNFVNYGTETTLRLGAGERAGVLYCFEDVHGRLPASQDDWDDVLKIANGRWPKQTNKTKESQAEVKFKEIYLREANRTNPHDDAAVVIVAYGLKPVHRSLESEKAALKTFNQVYKRIPTSNMDWKIIRAIAESGAKR